MGNLKIERIGEQNKNSMGEYMTIIDYVDYDNITVQFENGDTRTTSYRAFKKGNVAHRDAKGEKVRPKPQIVNTDRPDVSNEPMTYKQKGKLALVRAFGDKCQLCGNTYPYQIYDFHHIDPNEKDKGLANIGFAVIDRICEEAVKTVMLCPNCHRYHHYVEAQVFTRSNFSAKVYKREYKALRDGPRKRKIDLSREEFVALLRDNSLHQLEDIMGVSRSTIAYYMHKVYQIDWNEVGGRRISAVSRA